MYLKPAYDFSVYAAWNLRCNEFYMARGQKIFADDVMRVNALKNIGARNHSWVECGKLFPQVIIADPEMPPIEHPVTGGYFNSPVCAFWSFENISGGAGPFGFAFILRKSLYQL
jgi:hypothetical protein